MDMQKGTTLKELITQNHTILNEEAALTILEQILLTLDFMHKRGIILKQIDPENILINNIYHDRQEIDV
jgi:serine/threonine protein kinase